MSLNFETNIGVGCLVYRDSQLLLGQRINSHGHGTWSLPGGHLETDEAPFDCAIRETLEETGLHVVNPRVVTWAFNTFPERQRHYVTLFVQAEYTEGEPQCLEPEKCAQWDWFATDALPQPLFKPLASIQNLL